MDSMEQVTRPVPDLSGADARQIAEEIARVLYGKKASHIQVFRVDDTTVITDYYVIGTGRSSTHIHALADEVAYRLGLSGVRAYRTEGREGGEWLLIDFGVVIVHIFSREAREYYHIERLLKAENEWDTTALFETMQDKKDEETDA